jgi:hypothetical protein
METIERLFKAKKAAYENLYNIQKQRIKIIIMAEA